MSYFVDTSILARLANMDDPRHQLASDAIYSLHQRGEVLRITPQNLVELRNAATRPVAVDGIGLSASEAQVIAMRFEAMFPLLEETPAIFPLWKALVEAEGIIGKQVHDARLVAVCHAHRVTHLLTFNGPHFVRLSRFGPGVEVVDPSDV